MKRVNLFLILLIAAITALIAATVTRFLVFSANQQNPYSWMNQMWSGNTGNGYGGMGSMMGQNPAATQTTSTWLPYFGVVFAVLIVLTLTAVIGISYYLLYPQIRVGTPLPPRMPQETPILSTPVNAYESVAKTLTEEERQIVKVLQAHNGQYLQKYIKNETGLSRLKTHRIVARLSERGIVRLEKTGNTNQVTLADWLAPKI